MAQGIKIGTYVLTLSGSNTYYIGEYKKHVGSNIVLQNARRLVECHSPFLNVLLGKCGCLVSLQIDSIEVREVNRYSKLSDDVYYKFLSFPVFHYGSYDYTLAAKNNWYKLFYLQKVNSYAVQDVQGNAVIITQRHGRVGKGMVLSPNMTLRPCYTITFGNTTGVGDNLHKAYEYTKSIILSSTSHPYKGYDYASYVVDNYPDVDAEIPVLELIELHNIITNSCSSGINTFLTQHNINIDGTASMRTFLAVTKDAFAPEVIKSIADRYGITI